MSSFGACFWKSVHAHDSPLRGGGPGKNLSSVLEHLREVLTHYPGNLHVLLHTEIGKVAGIDKRLEVEIVEILIQLMSPFREGVR